MQVEDDVLFAERVDFIRVEIGWSSTSCGKDRQRTFGSDRTDLSMFNQSIENVRIGSFWKVNICLCDTVGIVKIASF